MKWNRMRSRPGLATIVTSAILLVSVVLMGTGTVIWENKSLSTNQLALSDAYSTNTDKIKENISIEKIWFGTTPQKFINITMTNQSPISIVVNQVQFSTTSGVVKFPSNQLIMPQKTGSMKITYSYTSNIPTTVVINTLRNSTFSTVVLPQ